MKLLLVTALLFCFVNANCQQAANSIETSNIHIINGLKQSYSFGPANQLQQAFGKTKAIKEADEVRGGFGYTYKYKGLTVDFHEHDWDSATVSGTEYAVVLNNIPYKIGENISKLKNAFPLSFKHPEKRSANNSVVWIDITNKKKPIDAFIHISFDNKGSITEIWIGNNDS